MDKTTKALLNSLRCPICKSQIDLYDYLQKNPRSTSYNFCCATDYTHYQMWFPHWENSSQINYDQVDIYEGKHKYRIDQRYLINQTIIYIWEVDIEQRFITEMSRDFIYDKILFDYPNTNRGRVVNRIKTILTFQ
jgi:hypothetical protein